MFLNTQKYHSTLGDIKFSIAKSKVEFQGKTKGLALKYVMDGTEHYQTRNGKVQLSKGQFIVLEKDEPYEVSFENKSQTTQGICIDLNLNLNQRLANLYENEILFKTVFNCTHFSPLGNLLQKISRKQHEQVNGAEVLNSISSELILFSSELSEMERGLGSFAKKSETKRELTSKLMLAKDFIYKNYNHKITLQHLSFKSGISKFHFSKLFKQCFHQSPFELQEALRMQKAKRMISANKIRLTEIAFQLGYSDLAAFSNQFKKYFGTSPSSFA